MMAFAYPQFSEKELQIKGTHESPLAAVPGLPVLDTPITVKKNLLLALTAEKPCWYPSVGMVGGEYRQFRPRIFPDNICYHNVMDGEPPIDWNSLPLEQLGWFDTVQKFVPVAGGPMIVPGSQKINDINDWEQLTWPNLDELDWEGCAKRNKAYLDSELPIEFGMHNGFWERLMSILEVDEAAVSLIDEDKQEACKAFLAKLTELYIDLVRRVKHYFDPDVFLIHDDWGHQNGPFFSYETCNEMIFPYFKRLVDEVHVQGMRFEHHCCGKAQDLVPLMVEAGVDLWCPQTINDTVMLVEKYRGQGITFGIRMNLASDMTDAELRVIASDFVDTYKDGSVAYVDLTHNPKFYCYVYELSRKALQ